MPLHVHIGSENPAKTNAVMSVFDSYRTRICAALSKKEWVGQIDYWIKEVDTGASVGLKPDTWRKTIRGAYIRASNALDNCPQDHLECVGVGIESGFISFPRDPTDENDPEDLFIENDVFNFDACCIIGRRRRDIKTQNIVYGFSPGIQYPRSPVQNILAQGDESNDWSEMNKQLNLKEAPPKEFGYLGVLTDGQFPRQRGIEIAVEIAVLRFISPRY